MRGSNSTDLSSVSTLSQLKVLHISNCLYLKDISLLCMLTSLEELTLNECYELISVDSLLYLESLIRLDLSYNGMYTFSMIDLFNTHYPKII